MTEQETLRRIQSPEYSSSSAAYHFLQPDVTRTELSDGSVVARIGSALMGAPIAPNNNLDRFARILSEDLPQVSVFHIEQDTALALRQRGYRIYSLGVEARISLPFSLQGRDKADLRRALNRADKAHITVRELSGPQFARYESRIGGLNQRWLNQRRHFRREFRFLARPFVVQSQPGERRFVALQSDTPVGIAAYDPVYQSGKLVGYFEALMRCETSSAPGVRDLLTVTAMRTFASEKSSARWLSLGLCPFAPLRQPGLTLAKHSVTQLALALFYNHGNRIFNCGGLAFHKARYRGIAIPVYFATKSWFPLKALYLACQQSNIDLFQPIRTRALSFLTLPKLSARPSMRQIRLIVRLLRQNSGDLLHSGHKRPTSPSK